MAYNKEGYEKNKAAHAKRVKAYRLRNKDKIKAASRIYYEKNKARLLAQSRQYEKDNPEKVRARQNAWAFRKLLKQYGLTMEIYERIVRRQQGLCAICRKPPNKQRLHFDHDHSTGQFRGLICGRCNWAMGKFEDDPNLLFNVIAYLGTSRGLTLGVFGFQRPVKVA